MEETAASGSREVARAALTLSMTATREEENALKHALLTDGIRAAAIDYGGDFAQSVQKLIERAVIAARREGVIEERHLEEGAVAGAAHEAVAQTAAKAMGLSVGGKLAVARRDEHVAVAVFFSVGLGHLNEVCVGLGHRAI
jgi:hypothetical protein